MQLAIHITFNGQCKDAFELYAKCLGGRITTLLTYGASPMASSAPDLADKVLHATLQLDGQRLTGVDVRPDAYEKPQGFAVQLNIDDSSQAILIFNTLASEGAVHLPLGKTFWAEHYGVLTDRFGVPWEINCTARG